MQQVSAGYGAQPRWKYSTRQSHQRFFDDVDRGNRHRFRRRPRVRTLARYAARGHPRNRSDDLRIDGNTTCRSFKCRLLDSCPPRDARGARRCAAAGIATTSRPPIAIEGPGFLDVTYNLRAEQDSDSAMLTAVLKGAQETF